jgi:hypothetical protein
MIYQNGKAAADQNHHKKEIEEVGVANPDRKALWPCKGSGIYLGIGWHVGHPERSDLDRPLQLQR